MFSYIQHRSQRFITMLPRPAQWRCSTLAICLVAVVFPSDHVRALQESADAAPNQKVQQKKSQSRLPLSAFAIPTSKKPKHNNPKLGLLIPDHKTMISDIKQLTADINLKSFEPIILSVFRLPEEIPLNPNTPVVQNSVLEEPEFITFLLKDREKFLKNNNINVKQDFEPFPFSVDSGMLGAMAIETDFAFLVGNHIVCHWDRITLDRIAKTLKQNLQKSTPWYEKHLQRFGLGIIQHPNADRFLSYLNLPSAKGKNLPKLESNLLSKISSLKLKNQFDGLKYKNKILEWQTIIPLDMKPLSDEIDFQKAKEDWSPSLGLEKKGLVAAGAINFGAFKSSAIPRFASKAYSPLLGLMNSGRIPPGSRLKSLLSLSADSWMDCSASRIAVYRYEGARPTGDFYNVIGVIDTKDKSGKVVLEELQKISLFTFPLKSTKKKEQRLEEITNRITDLHSDPVTEARAETRLSLGSEETVRQLKKVIQSKDPQRTDAAKRIVSRIESRLNPPATQNFRNRGVTSWGFWLDLNPQLEFLPGKVTKGRATHKIIIHPDPSKTPQEVKEASLLMKNAFGPDWNTITIKQIPGHFIFLLGSDHQRLGRITDNVLKKVSSLEENYPKGVIADANGPVRVFINFLEVNKIQRQRFSDDFTPSIPGPIARGGLFVSDREIRTWLQCPVRHFKTLFHY